MSVTVIKYTKPKGSDINNIGSSTSFTNSISTEKSEREAADDELSNRISDESSLRQTEAATKLNITGNNGTAAGVSSLINKLSTGTSIPTDNDFFVSQYVAGGITTTTYHRRPISTLWSYIFGKINSVLGLYVDSDGHLKSTKGFYDTKFISTLGSNSTSGGGGIDESTLWAILGGSSQNYYILAQYLTPQLNSVYATKLHNHTWDNISSTPTTLAGYGITDNIVIYRGIASDCNTSLESGFYTITPDTNNIPTGAYNYGYLFVYKWDNSTIYQHYIPHGESHYSEYKRGKYTGSSVFGNWISEYDSLNSKISTEVSNRNTAINNGTVSYVKYSHTNEINFKNVSSNTRHWFNYRNPDTDSTDSINKITDYYFGNRNGSVDGVNLNAETYKTTTNYNCYATLKSNGIEWHLTASQNRAVGLTLYNSSGTNFGDMIGAEFDNTSLKAIFLNGNYSSHKVRILQNGHVIFGGCTNNTTTDRQVRILGDLGMDGNILPYPSLTYNLGSSSYSWQRVYTRYLDTISGYDLRICVAGTERLHINSSDGNVGIGNTSPSEKLHVSGNIYATGAVTALVTNSSDKRLKKDIQSFKALSIVDKLNPVSFRWNNTAKAECTEFTDKIQYGLIAQEADGTIDDLVFTMPNGYKGVRYEKLIPVLLESVKELKENNDNLKAELTELKEELNEIKQLLKLKKIKK